MKNLFNKILLLGLLIATANSALAIEPPLFDALYWGRGNVTIVDTPATPASVPLNQRQVVFYKELGPNLVVVGNVFGVTGDPILGSGKYMINIYDNGLLPIYPGQKYSIAVLKGADNYGADAKEVTIDGSGYFTADLDISYGKGPILPVDNGLIKSIYIFPDSGKPKITWDCQSAVNGAIIYRYIPSGADFSKNPDDWTPIETKTDNSVKYFTDSSIPDNVTAYYLVIPYQVNAVPTDKTFMFEASPVVPGDYLKKDAGGIPYTSWPVARFAMPFTAGESKLMGYPFYPTASTGFISKLSQITTQSEFKDGSIWVNSGGLMRYNCGGDGTWTGDLSVSPATGYWLMSNSAKTYYFYGALIQASHTKDMTVGSDMYSYAFPVSINQGTELLSGGYSSGDSIWINKGGLLRYNYTGSWSGNFTLLPADAFWYLNVAANKKLQTIP